VVSDLAARERALLIAISGPAIQLVGLAWEGAHFLISHLDTQLSVRHLVFEPGVLLMAVGLLVSIVAAPLATEVARAAPEELEIPVFGIDGRQREARAFGTPDVAAEPRPH